MLHEKEALTDNTKIQYCKQCKDCILWGNENPYSNKYDKSSCYRFPFPNHKPSEVINNTGICPFREAKNED